MIFYIPSSQCGMAPTPTPEARARRVWPVSEFTGEEKDKWKYVDRPILIFYRKTIASHLSAWSAKRSRMIQKLISSMFRVLLAGLVIFVLFGCREQKPYWPGHVLAALVVPENATRVHYYMLGATYQVSYAIRECHPATDFLETMAQKMTESGWSRRSSHSLNPHIRLNHSKTRGAEWDMFIDKNGRRVLQWIDEWEDRNGNSVTYGLKYDIPDQDPQAPCILHVVVIYAPTDSGRQGRESYNTPDILKGGSSAVYDSGG